MSILVNSLTFAIKCWNIGDIHFWDRQTDRQTKQVIEAPCRSLKIVQLKKRGQYLSNELIRVCRGSSQCILWVILRSIWCFWGLLKKSDQKKTFWRILFCSISTFPNDQPSGKVWFWLDMMQISKSKLAYTQDSTYT